MWAAREAEAHEPASAVTSVDVIPQGVGVECLDAAVAVAQQGIAVEIEEIVRPADRGSDLRLRMRQLQSGS